MNKNRLSRRNFLRQSLAAVGAAALAGCAPAQTVTKEAPAAPAATAPAPAAVTAVPEATSPAPAPQEKVAIDFWWGWTPELHVKTINSVVDKFVQAHPNVKVNTGQHEWGEKLLTALAAGSPPDLFEQNAPQEYAAKGVVIPIDDLLATSKTVSKDTFVEGWVKGSTWKGQIFGLPSMEYFADMAVMTNKALAESNGITVPDGLAKTWDEWYEQTVKFSKFDDAGNIKHLWFIPVDLYQFLGPSLGVPGFDGDNLKFTFNDPAWLEMVNQLVKYYDFFGAEKLDSLFNTYPNWTAVAGCSLCSDVQAANIDGYWAPGELSKTAPDKQFAYTWTPVPTARKGKKVQMIGGHQVMIAKVSKNPDTAWTLAEYLTTNEAMQVLFEGTGFLMATKAFIKDPKSVVNIDKYHGLSFYVNSLAQADEIYTWPGNPIDAFVTDAFSKAYKAVVYKEKTAEQTLIDLQKACEDELAKAI
jgi:ABC-type glycerol-3-phosphate transport system substrate-binding protein